MNKSIRHTLFFPHPPEVVWDYITKPDLIAQWLMKSDFKPVKGHEFQFKVGPMPQLNFDGIFHCKVLEVTPLKSLSYSWKFGSGDGVLHDSQVNWTLTKKDNGTELQLIHDAFEGAEMIPLFGTLDKGWIDSMKTMLKRINTYIDGTTKA